MASLTGNDDGSGFGVKGHSATGSGVIGEGAAWAGVVASSVTGSGVSAFSDSGAGVLSVSNSGPGVSGESVRGNGVVGKSADGAGVVGEGPTSAGVVASSVSGAGVSAFSDSGAGVMSVSNSGPAVSGQSVQGIGVLAKSDFAEAIKCSSGQGIGVLAESATSVGMLGTTGSPDYAAVLGQNTAAAGGRGVHGRAAGIGGVGVTGESLAGDDSSIGVHGSSSRGRGVVGVSRTSAGVEGATFAGIGVYGGVTSESDERRGTGRGVVGAAISATGVEGQSQSGVGVWGSSIDSEGVHGETSSVAFAAIAGIQLNPHSTGAGVYGEHRGNGTAGFFKGNVVVTGHIEFAGADCAELFEIAQCEERDAPIEAGTVMVIDSENALRPCAVAYDRRVAGVVAGAGAYVPGIVLGTRDDDTRSQPVALLGRVLCKVDAAYGPIETGDLLTTSSTAGCAMKATDATRAFGAVLGKALRPLDHGIGLIPILVALQ
jgi:hypothetical protein